MTKLEQIRQARMALKTDFKALDNIGKAYLLETIGVEHLDTIHQALQIAEAAIQDRMDNHTHSSVLERQQPCGCIVCTCEDEERCHGCGAKECGEKECVFVTGNSVWTFPQSRTDKLLDEILGGGE